jgi:hypothetical protein
MTTMPKETSMKRHPASRTFLSPTTAGRTSQARTSAEKKIASAPTIDDATSQRSSEASAADPGAGLQRTPLPLRPRPVKFFLGARLRRSPIYRRQTNVQGRPATHPGYRARCPTPDCPPCPRARTRDPTPTSSSSPPHTLYFVYFIDVQTGYMKVHAASRALISPQEAFRF